MAASAALALCDDVIAPALAYRPYLSRMNRRNWPALLIFPALALGGAALVWVPLSGLSGFIGGLTAGAPRLDFAPGGVRAFGAGVLLLIAGGLPLAPIPDPKARGIGAAGLALRVIGAIALVALVAGPSIGVALVEQVVPAHGYRACPATGRSNLTLHWVRPATACPGATG